MFQTFTGSSRKPRQVNLGGPKNNPFAKASAVQNAQAERENRQKERDRLKSTKFLQRRWRGYMSRTRSRKQWREDFDRGEDDEDGEAPYEFQETALIQLQRLLQFAGEKIDRSDVPRLHRYITRLRATLNREDVICAGGPWPMAYLRLQKLILTLIRTMRKTTTEDGSADLMLEMLAIKFIGRQIPDLELRNAKLMYSAIGGVLEGSSLLLHKEQPLLGLMTSILAAPLSSPSTEKEIAYQALAAEVLTTKAATMLPFYPKWLNKLAVDIDPRELASTVSTLVSSPDYLAYKPMQIPIARYKLLGAFIYLYRQAHKSKNNLASASHQDFVRAISALLLSLASEISRYDLGSEYSTGDNEDNDFAKNKFAKEQMLTLVDQESIRSLLGGSSDSMNTAGTPQLNDEAQQLATYALTLLRFFPRRADEIRMWLYMGSTGSSSTPAIKFFWQATRSAEVFQTISRDIRSVIRLLKSLAASDVTSVQDDWRVILIFLELYTFVLKLMDDEEFFSASSLSTNDSTTSSWARTNALPLDDVKDLTIFLKHLAFQMYFRAKEIAEESNEAYSTDTASLSSYFKVATSPLQENFQTPMQPKEASLAGLQGISVEYVKGLVTGLLRMIHERDSRRKFLDKDHWLMTSHFEMGSFIPTVVAEEENRRMVEDDGDDGLQGGYEDIDDEGPQYAGTARDRNIRQQQRLERQQKKISRQNYLRQIAPRSEILQNMPFFIPFTTRVEIFREFVKRDQTRRRDGLVDAELWRISMANSMNMSGNSNLARHTATVRRGYEFEDAFDQFYSLGEGLKEPIQITFEDKFGQQEAGIDGGGVTKEFLTSVTNEAFKPSDGLDMFKENEQRLLFPNPTALDEKKEFLRQFGVRARTPEYNKEIFDLLKKYEFLGRIMGKCLYEGILVDINFAPFFLLKWALTGGDGAAPRESSYRANLNDLRDIDQDLYKGLIQLKNYPGNVQEDMALDFTIADTFTVNYATGEEKTVTKDLRPGGADMPVTNENRLVYISYVARHRLVEQPYAQTNAFLKGLSSMISPSWLSMFNQSELQTLISGTSSQISIPDLRRNTAYGGVYVIGDDGLEHPTVQMFWQVMEALEDKDRRKVLKFVTSTPRAPLLGFGSLTPRFSIRDSSDDETRLPSTSTCVNLLKLPRYKDERTLKEKLLYAVNSGAGFDLS